MRDGTIDVIATDHAPHHYDEKEREFADAPNGIVGLETALAVNITWLVAPGIIDLPTLVEKMSCAPARIFRLAGRHARAAATSPTSRSSIPTPNGRSIRRAFAPRDGTRRTPASGCTDASISPSSTDASSIARGSERAWPSGRCAREIVRVCRRLYERG